jgi:hypothetical protein
MPGSPSGIFLFSNFGYKKIGKCFPQKEIKIIEFTLEKQRVPKFSQAFGSQKGQN